MLEESFKTIEGPAAQRKNKKQDACGPMELSTSPLIWQAKSRNVPPPKCYTQTLLSAKTPRSTTGSSVAFRLITKSNTMLYDLRRVKLWKNAWESQSKPPPLLRRHSLASPLSSKPNGGSPTLLFQTLDLSKDLCLALNKPNLRNPPSYRSVLLGGHFTVRSMDVGYMQPGSWMTPSTMEADRVIWRPLCVSSRSVAWRLGSATPGLSSRPLPPTGTKPSTPLAPHSHRMAFTSLDGTSGKEEW